MAKREIIVTPAFYISAAHTENDVKQTVAAAHEVFTIIRLALDGGCVSERLEAQIVEEPFRRLVI